MHHFGQGIVGTPGDFGRMGERPTNPALLDWLATELVDSGRKFKRLHKLIMMSDAYRQASTSDERRAAIDGENRLLWRQRVRRLDAEAIRDRVLATSGALNGRMFGPSTPVAVDNVGQVTTGESKVPDAPTRVAELQGGDESRRSVYLQVRRSQPIAMLRTFDAPVMETNCDRRVSSTVSPQALMLMNSTFVVGEAKRFALRVRLEAGADPKAQVAQAWQLAYARAPAEAEIASSEEFLRRQVEELAKTPTPEGQPAPDHALQALTDLCHVLLGSNEFLYVD
jgi:hypothetical protein